MQGGGIHRCWEVMTRRPGSCTRGDSRVAGRSTSRASAKSTRREASKGASAALRCAMACAPKEVSGNQPLQQHNLRHHCQLWREPRSRLLVSVAQGCCRLGCMAERQRSC